jgi:hypothetical protein
MKQEKLQRQSVVISADGVDAGPAKTCWTPCRTPECVAGQRARGSHGSAVTTTASDFSGEDETQLSHCSIASSARGF